MAIFPILMSQLKVLRKASNSPVMFFLPHWTTRLLLEGFSWNLISGDFSKAVEKIQAWLIPNKSNGYFTLRPISIYGNISPSYSLNEKCIRRGVVVKALRYYSEGPRIDPRSCHWGFFSEESDKSVCPGLTQPFEMSVRIFLGVKTAGAQGWQPYHLNVPIA
jgi:hypothetical protein